MRRIWLVLSVALSLEACIRPEEGCLDTEATNYNVMADRNCCCTYPGLVLNLQYLAGNQPFNPTAEYLDAGDNAYRITRIAFYLSDIGLVQEGQHLTGNDSLWVYSDKPGGGFDSTRIMNNVRLINRTGFSINAGSFIYSGDFSHLRFRLGLPENLNNNAWMAYPRGNPLFIQADSMHTFEREQGYLFIKIETEQVENGEKRVLELFGDANSTWVEVPIQYTAVKGEDRRVNLAMDIPAFLNGVNLVTDTPDDVQLKLKQNIPLVFKG